MLSIHSDALQSRPSRQPLLLRGRAKSHRAICILQAEKHSLALVRSPERPSITSSQFPAPRRNRGGDVSQKVALFPRRFTRAARRRYSLACRSVKNRARPSIMKAVRGQTNCIRARHVRDPHIHFTVRYIVHTHHRHRGYREPLRSRLSYFPR